MEDKIGECQFDFVKVDNNQRRLYIAVRFESKEHAKECMNRYKDGQLFGYDVDVTWFRDIRRYIAYCQKKGIRPRPARPRYNSRRNYSRSRSRSHSKSKSRSRSYSYSPSVSRSRSRSRSTRKSSASPARSDRYNRSEERKKSKTKSPTPSPPRKKKSKKDKKKKKKRSRTPSRSRSPSVLDMDMSDGEKSTNGHKLERENGSPKKEEQFNHVNRGITFSLDLDSNNPTVTTKSRKGGGKWDEQSVNVYTNVKPVDPVEAEHKGKFIPVDSEVPVEQKQPIKQGIKQENNNGDADQNANIANKSKVALSLLDGIDDAPGTAMNNFKKIQKTILQEVRYKPPEVPDSPPTGGTLRLRTIQKKNPDAIREEKMARLSKELREKVEKKKLQLELAYRQDCETFGFVAQNLISKDRSLEERIRLALLESMKEMETGILKQLDEYIDQLLLVSSSQ